MEELAIRVKSDLKTSKKLGKIKCSNFCTQHRHIQSDKTTLKYSKDLCVYTIIDAKFVPVVICFETTTSTRVLMLILVM